MIKRKSQGLSLNMIVVGAIAIVVLVVIVLIFNASIQNIEDKTEGKYIRCMSLDQAHYEKDTKAVQHLYNKDKTTVLRLSDLPDEFNSLEEYCTAPTGKGGKVYRGVLQDVRVGSGEICCYDMK